ncbi:MAG: hypothetical protein CMK52_05110 [Proteobacteria bacterium]|nr:hypothetical protein [Pseudomonadota bacterium]|tara:strand:+ start:1627 stop:1866 length:240 start_codon:yes stop_codon:yes gene_type:complete
MKIEFKNVATVADIKKAFETAEIPDEAKIIVHYDYDLTSSEDTQVVRDTIAKSQGKLRFNIHEIRQDQDNELNIYLQFD